MDLIIDLHFLPSIEYFCAISMYQSVYLEAQESYVKGSYRNKTHIITSAGVHRLSIPLMRGKHQQKNIQAVDISYNEDWQRQHWRSLKTAYQNAPFWADYSEEVLALLDLAPKTLWDYNLSILKGLLDILQIDTPLLLTEDYVVSYPDSIDLRQQLLPKNKEWVLQNIQSIPYEQVFEDRLPFYPNASILDLLFCKGPESALILEKMTSSSFPS